MLRKASLLIAFLFCLACAARADMGVREIRVAVAVSPNFEVLPEWKSEFERRLAYASQIFESEFKIKFTVTRYLKWTPADETTDMPTLVDELRTVVPLQDVDMVIGLTHLKETPQLAEVRELHTIGQARPFSGYLVLRYPMNKLFKVQEDTVMTHELGHIFGAVHTKDKNSIMYPVVDRQLPVRFDSSNHEIILHSRALNFQRGPDSLPPDVLQTLLNSYVKMAVQDQSADFYYALGLFYLHLGQPDDAMKAWKLASDKDNGNAELHYNLGALYYKTDRYTPAISELSRAVSMLGETGPPWIRASALKMLGDAYFQKGNMFAASRSWTAAMKLTPDDTELQANLASIEFKQGQIVNALVDFEKVLQKDPHNVKAMVYSGMALHQDHQAGEALKFFELALQELNSRPRTPEQVSWLAQVHGQVGTIHMEAGDKKESFEHFQAACDLIPSEECHRNLGMMLFQNQQWDAASHELAAVLQYNKEDVDIYGLLGTALAQKDDAANAIAVFREGLKYAKDPKVQSRFYHNVGNLFITNHQYELAENEFHMALTKDWSDVDNHFGLAMSALGKNEAVEAINSLRDVLRIDPNNQRAKAMLESIQNSLNSAQPAS